MPDTDPPGPVYRFGGFELDTERFRLTGPSGPIAGEPRILGLLIFLIENRERVVTKDELIDAVWDGRALGDAAVSRAVYLARKYLGEDARRQELIATVHGRGYRFVGELTPEQAGAGETPGARRRLAKLGLPAVVVLLSVAIVLTWWSQRRVRPWPPPEPVVRIAVVPPVADKRLLEIALCEGIADRLATLPGVVVRRCHTTASLAARAESLTEVAAHLGADAVVHGSVSGSPPRLEISLLTLEDGTNRGLAGLPVPADLATSAASFATACDRVAAELGRRLVGRSPETDDGLSPGDMTAYGLYLRGAWAGPRRCNDEGRLELLARATARAPGFAPGWVLLAEEHLRLAGPCGGHPSHYESALDALDRAAELEASPPLVAPLRARALLGLGRPEEAYESVVRAGRRRADPRLDWAAAHTLLYAGAPELARWHRKRALEGDPDGTRFAPEAGLLALELDGGGSLAAAASGGSQEAGTGRDRREDPAELVARALAALRHDRRAAALEALRPAFRADPTNHYARLAEALRAILEGTGSEGLRILDEIARTRRAVGGGDAAIDYRIGQAYALAGSPEEALGALRRAGRGFFCVACAEADPLWGELREAPAFDEALRPAGARSRAFARRFGLPAPGKSP